MFGFFGGKFKPKRLLGNGIFFIPIFRADVGFPTGLVDLILHNKPSETTEINRFTPLEGLRRFWASQQRFRRNELLIAPGRSKFVIEQNCHSLF